MARKPKATSNGTARRSEAPAYGIPAVEKAIKLLRHISEGESVANLSHTASALRINRTTLMRLIASLEAGRFIEKKPYGLGYQIGPGLIGVAAQTFLSRDLNQTALPYLITLSEEFGLSTHLGILEGRDVLYLLRQVPHVFRASAVRVGSRLPAHATSMGRIMLAYLPEAQLRALFDGAALEAATEQTVTTIDDLVAETRAARQAGLAWSHSSYEAGVDSCAAPIFDHSGLVVAAINITGPESAFSIQGGKRARISEALRRAALNISERLGYVPPAEPRATQRGSTA
ncbi:IclR family transcriptional regulator [Bradyrhizobium sp. 2TAF24]|uniref:IclR family transcriptional regulator n=1 Tax=Bradyrhizobium sp. 2TAF24 TaxID=3233011 RepID=UPI003F92EE22